MDDKWQLWGVLLIQLLVQSSVNTELSDLRISTCLKKSGLGCSKLTMLLVNVSLKLQMLISQIHQYLLLKKCEKLLQASLIFSIKNIRVFGCKVVKHLMS